MYIKTHLSTPAGLFYSFSLMFDIVSGLHAGKIFIVINFISFRICGF